MKKTLTVNLGGTVFNIDEDAYRLLDNYLNNLKLHFRKHSSAEEIVDDIELRISELFAEKLQTGAQVITIADVEEVIARMGKPEDMDTDTEPSSDENTKTTGHRRFFRNPDDKMLGGVISGAAAYFGLNVTTLRLAMVFLLIFSFKILIPLYIICWIIVPEARTAAEKLSMRGEAVTVENIGKTVTDGFEKVGNGVNEYIRSDKPRSFLASLGNAIVTVVGWILKMGLIAVAVICSPVLFIFAVVFVALLFMAIVIGIGGGAALLSLFPTTDIILPISPMSTIVIYIAGTLMQGIPLLGIVYGVCRSMLKWQAMATGLKWTLLILWVVSTAIFAISFTMNGFDLPDLLIHI